MKKYSVARAELLLAWKIFSTIPTPCDPQPMLATIGKSLRTSHRPHATSPSRRPPNIPPSKSTPRHAMPRQATPLARFAAPCRHRENQQTLATPRGIPHFQEPLISTARRLSSLSLSCYDSCVSLSSVSSVCTRISIKISIYIFQHMSSYVSVYQIISLQVSIHRIIFMCSDVGVCRFIKGAGTDVTFS